MKFKHGGRFQNNFSANIQCLYKYRDQISEKQIENINLKFLNIGALGIDIV